MSVPCMGAPQLTSSSRSPSGVARQPTTSTKYTTVDGLGSLGKPQRFDLGQNRGLQVLSAGLVSGIQSISQQFSDFQKQLGSARRSMVAESAQKIAPRLNLAGRWNKDKSASDMDGYGRSLDLMGIHGFKKKTALVLMDGVEIIQDDAGKCTLGMASLSSCIACERPTRVACERRGHGWCSMCMCFWAPAHTHAPATCMTSGPDKCTCIIDDDPLGVTCSSHCQVRDQGPAVAVSERPPDVLQWPHSHAVSVPCLGYGVLHRWQIAFFFVQTHGGVQLQRAVSDEPA